MCFKSCYSLIIQIMTLHETYRDECDRRLQYTIAILYTSYSVGAYAVMCNNDHADTQLQYWFRVFRFRSVCHGALSCIYSGVSYG